MSDRDQEPDEDIEQEAAVSLPERDAMSVIRGPSTMLPLPPEVAPGSGPADIAPEPMPPIDKIDPQPPVV
jgi:hypothetical protein